MKFISGLLVLTLLSMGTRAQLTPYDSALLGKKVYHISLRDVDGSSTTLEKFKGKYLYVDFWFTGCKPCIEEFPKSKALEAKIDRDDLVFVTISFDSNDDIWQNTLAKYGVVGEHFRVADDRSRRIFAEEFKIVYFPFYWLVSPDGTLIHPNAKRPGVYLQDGSLVKFIDSH